MRTSIPLESDTRNKRYFLGGTLTLPDTLIDAKKSAARIRRTRRSFEMVEVAQEFQGGEWINFAWADI